MSRYEILFRSIEHSELFRTQFTLALLMTPQMDFVRYVDSMFPNTLKDGQGGALELGGISNEVFLAVNAQCCCIVVVGLRS